MDEGEPDDGSRDRGGKRPASVGDDAQPRKKRLAARAAQRALPERWPSPGEQSAPSAGLIRAVNRVVAGSQVVRQRDNYIRSLPFPCHDEESGTEDDENPAPRPGPKPPRMSAEIQHTKTTSYLLRQESALASIKAANAATNRKVMELARTHSCLAATGRALEEALEIAMRAADYAEELRLSTDANLADFASFKADELPPRGEDPAPAEPEDREAAMSAIVGEGTSTQATRRMEMDMILEEAIRNDTALRLEEERRAVNDLGPENEKLREDIIRWVEVKARRDEETNAAAAALEMRTRTEGA
jgi:hypothetical protein